MVIYGQMRMLYARSYRLARIFYICSRNVLIELDKSVCVFVTVVICEHIITRHHSLKKIVAYIDLHRKILNVSRRSSANAKFVNNTIPTFKCLIRRNIFFFYFKIKSVH